VALFDGHAIWGLPAHNRAALLAVFVNPYRPFNNAILTRHYRNPLFVSVCFSVGFTFKAAYPALCRVAVYLQPFADTHTIQQRVCACQQQNVKNFRNPAFFSQRLSADSVTLYVSCFVDLKNACNTLLIVLL
jgi:hypothetical protein